MAQLSKIVNAALISQTGLYLNIISEFCRVMLVRKAHGNILHQNFFVFVIKKKLMRKKLKLLQQRHSPRKPRKFWCQLERSDQSWQDMINSISPDDWSRKISFFKENFF